MCTYVCARVRVGTCRGWTVCCVRRIRSSRLFLTFHPPTVFIAHLTVRRERCIIIIVIISRTRVLSEMVRCVRHIIIIAYRILQGRWNHRSSIEINLRKTFFLRRSTRSENVYRSFNECRWGIQIISGLCSDTIKVYKNRNSDKDRLESRITRSTGRSRLTVWPSVLCCFNVVRRVWNDRGHHVIKTRSFVFLLRKTLDVQF